MKTKAESHALDGLGPKRREGQPMPMPMAASARRQVGEKINVASRLPQLLPFRSSLETTKHFYITFSVFLFYKI